MVKDVLITKRSVDEKDAVKNCQIANE